MRSACIVALIALLSAACSGFRDRSVQDAARDLTGGDPARGREMARNYGCGTCHTIPGVAGANATVGPPLTQVALRTYLAGRVQNTPANMVQWIRYPHRIDDKTAMPETGVTERDGKDIAAFLYTLR